MIQRCLLTLALVLSASLNPARVVAEESAASAQAPSREELQFFETSIRPLLANRCFKCHGEQKQNGSLRLDGLNTMLTGGDSGPAIVPGKPDESLLIEAVRYESYEMPPTGQLPDEEIDLLVRWIEMGAPWPAVDRNVAAPTSGQITDDDRKWWAFQPLTMPEVPSMDAGGSSDSHDGSTDSGQRTTDALNPIDAFILRKLAENDLHLSPPADRLTLVRRVYQDVIGLPPTPEQIDAFLSDESDQAYTRLIDELLESPRYGEHWATFWLDLVRYADSDGFKADFYRPHAWHFRDYVIQSFNDDKPYDRFVQEQLAGDEIAPNDPQALAATGYLRHGIYEYNQRDAFTQWQDILNDITDTTGDVFLAMGMGCARCHDHKFDAILQKDYYRLQAFFAGLGFRDDVPLATAEQQAEYERKMAAWRDQTSEIRAQLDALERPKLERLAEAQIMMFPQETQDIMAKPADERTAHEKQIAHLVHLQVIDKQKQLDTKFKGDEKQQWESLKEQLAAFDADKPAPLPEGQTISDIAPTAPAVFIPGKERLGEVEPGFLSALDEAPAEFAPLPTSPRTTGRRAALARWLTRPDNPLTSRVIVNRIWQQYFGQGLVATPSDFGRLGERPSHPELLDWLAVRFIESGWSLKWLHRQILTSQTYRQASVVEPSALATKRDPGNRLLWRQNIRRMTAEQIRDALLLVSGRLVHTGGGPPEEAATSRHRSVYTKILRNTRDPLLDVFDLPDRITGTGTRNVTTTPAQSLLLINSPRMMDAATAFAMRLDRELPQGGESQIRLGYRLAYGRDPSEQELRLPEAILGDDIFGTEQQSTASETLVTMPATGKAAVRIDPEQERSLLRMEEHDRLPTGDFTVEAIVLLNSLYPNASVRTIASQWSGNTEQAGWSLGVTSTKSKYGPRNLILQLVGNTNPGERNYEVIASGIHLELNKPYYVAVSVDLDETSESGVTFYVRRLGLAEEESRSAGAAHQVKADYANKQALVIGGRDGNGSHRWDGLVDEVRLTGRVLSEEELLINSQVTPAGIVGWWTFEDKADLFADASGSGLRLKASDSATQVSPGLVDFCHVLLNSNEFLYVD